MMFLRTENKIEPKKSFHLEIEQHFNGISNNVVMDKLQVSKINDL